MEVKLDASVQPQADLLTLLEHQPTGTRRPREWLGRAYRQPGHGVVGAALRDVDLFADLLELNPLARRRRAIARCSGVRPGLCLTRSLLGQSEPHWLTEKLRGPLESADPFVPSNWFLRTGRVVSI